MKKILFPTDFSETAAAARDYTAKLAAMLGAKVDALHVFNLPFAESAGMSPQMLEEMIAAKKQLVSEKLAQFLQPIAEPYRGEAIAVMGVFVPEEINDLVKARKYDLVAMGTLGEKHTQLEKILGSVTSQTMLRVSACPVLAIPAHASWNGGIRRIAYATDFQPEDEKAASQLLDLALQLGAEVHFVHVDTKSQIGDKDDYVLLEKYPFDFTRFAVINNPNVIEGIDRYLHESAIDLLALFMPRRKLWERLFHSSFTKKMVFHSRIPLLVFHHPENPQ